MSELTRDSNNAPHESGFDLAAWLDVLILYRWMMLAIFVVAAAIGTAWVLLSAPVYEADIIVQVEESGAADAARSVLGGLSSMFDVKASAESEQQVIASRLVVAAAVDRERLFIDAQPRRFPVIGAAIARGNGGVQDPGWLGIGGYTWGAEQIDIDRFDVPSNYEEERYDLTVARGGAFRLAGPGLIGDVAGRCGEQLRVRTDNGPLVLQVRSFNAKPGARFRLVRYPRQTAIEQLQRDLSVKEAGKDSNVLRVSLRGNDPQRLVATLDDIATFYLDQNIARKTEEAARSLAFLEGREPELRHSLDAAEAALSTLRVQLKSVSTDGEAASLLQQSAQNEVQLTGLLQKRAELASRFLPGHDAVIAIDDQIAVLRAESQRLVQSIARLPADQRRLISSERDVKVANDLYVSLLNNIEQMKLIHAGRIGDVRLIDKALAPDRPMHLRRAIEVCIAIFLAGFAAVFAAWVRDLLFRGVSDANEVESATGLRVFASVPRAAGCGLSASIARMCSRRNTSRCHPHAIVASDDPAIENLRSLRTAVRFSILGAQNNVVMFTGPTQGVGKSFVSSNFAEVMAASGKRVLLIDGDMRRSGLAAIYGDGRLDGFADVLADRITLDGAIRQTGRTNLHFLPAGQRPSNASDLLANAAVAVVIKAVAARYDVVVIDTAPVLPVSDAAMLAPYAAGNVFAVVRAGATHLGELKETVRRLQRVGVDITGVILNGIDPRAGRFRYGAKYGAYRYSADSGTDVVRAVAQQQGD
ncbi:polysaccharide biosynthesis tyrosine autokinase [Paraburkholderia phymatum]|uniref:Polysaccharide biosynthesis tyrosine autokinase n=1 Tax=Paraburkholderia phymatum TaxID=148447 RepID=A0ACC6TX04_9BURK